MVSFLQVDTDGSGVITLTELKDFFLAVKKRYSCNRQQAEEILSRK